MSAPVQQVPGLKRIDLQEHDLSAPGRVVIQNRIEFTPDVPAFRHKHPGEEITYVLEGSVEYSIDAQPPQTYSAGDALIGPPGDGPRGAECRQSRRGAAVHLHPREREAVPGFRRLMVPTRPPAARY